MRSADGTELAAEEIVSGTFRNVAGTVISTDACKQEFTVMDLATKKPVTLRITTDSQLRKLPAMVAQRIAMRLRGGSPDGGSDAPAAGGGPSAPAKAGETRPNGGAGGVVRAAHPIFSRC